MSVGLKLNIKTMLRVLLAALLMSYYAGATLFPHTHSYTWGNVTHSHPYLPSGNHTHSAAGLQFINNLTNLVFVLGFASVLLVIRPTVFVFRAGEAPCVVRLDAPHCPLRAPPVY